MEGGVVSWCDAEGGRDPFCYRRVGASAVAIKLMAVDVGFHNFSQEPPSGGSADVVGCIRVVVHDSTHHINVVLVDMRSSSRFGDS